MIFTETKILVHFYKKVPGHHHPFPWFFMTSAVFHDFPGLENGLTKFHGFPWLSRKSGHPGCVGIEIRILLLLAINCQGVSAFVGNTGRTMSPAESERCHILYTADITFTLHVPQTWLTTFGDPSFPVAAVQGSDALSVLARTSSYIAFRRHTNMLLLKASFEDGWMWLH